jgi:hypothetical protein
VVSSNVATFRVRSSQRRRGRISCRYSATCCGVTGYPARPDGGQFQPPHGNIASGASDHRALIAQMRCHKAAAFGDTYPGQQRRIAGIYGVPSLSCPLTRR